MSNQKSIFEKIFDGEIPATIFFKDDHHIAFADIHPEQKTHVLVVPRTPYVSIDTMSTAELGMLMKRTISIAESVLKLPSYSTKVNVHPPIQEVLHVHVHILSPFAHQGSAIVI